MRDGINDPSVEHITPLLSLGCWGFFCDISSEGIHLSCWDPGLVSTFQPPNTENYLPVFSLLDMKVFFENNLLLSLYKKKSVKRRFPLGRLSWMMKWSHWFEELARSQPGLCPFCSLIDAPRSRRRLFSASFWENCQPPSTGTQVLPLSGQTRMTFVTRIMYHFLRILPFQAPSSIFFKLNLLIPTRLCFVF